MCFSSHELKNIILCDTGSMAIMLKSLLSRMISFQIHVVSTYVIQEIVEDMVVLPARLIEVPSFYFVYFGILLF